MPNSNSGRTMIGENNMQTRIREFVEGILGEEGDGVLLADGFEEAFSGIGIQYTKPPVAIYDRAECIECLVRSGLTHEEAEEYFSYNVEGAWVGEQTPIFYTKFEKGGEEDASKETMRDQASCGESQEGCSESSTEIEGEKSPPIIQED